MKKKVLLAMSGGIDSTVAAILLQQNGFEVTGITFNLLNSSNTVEELKDITEKLKINHIFIDLRDKFQKEVIDYFADEYIAGRTPFPCLVCNNKIKWPYLMKYMNKLHHDYIATGHYARIIKEQDNFYIQCGIDKDKDQSFFLWAIPQEILNQTLFPLGDLLKSKVRKIADESGFSNLNLKKESTGPCFIEKGDYRPFLKKLIKARNLKIGEGNFVDDKGKILGRHKGYPYYTIGQRRGLDYISEGASYVNCIDPINNQVVLGDKQSLFLNSFIIDKYHYAEPEKFLKLKNLKVRIRYRKQETPCYQQLTRNLKIEVILLEPLDAVAPGQSAVFYQNDKVIGGGFIHSV